LHTRISQLTFVLILITLVVTTLAYGAVHQPILALFYLTVGLMILLWTADCLVNGTLRFSRSTLQLPLVLLAVYGLIQAISLGTRPDGSPWTISLDQFATQVTALHIVLLSAFFFLTLTYIDSAARLRRLATLITIFGAIYAFYAILQSVLSPDAIYGIYRPRSATPFGSFVNKHDFAAIMEMTMSVPLGLLFAGAVRGDKRLLYLVAILLMGASVVVSGSRGGLVTLFAGVIFLVIITTRSSGPRALLLKGSLAVFLVLGAIGGAVFVGGDTSLTRFADAAQQSNVTSSRSHIWSVSLDVIRSHLPFGTGLGSFGQAYTRFDTSAGQLRVNEAHNDYLQIVADAGVIGLVLGGWFLYLFVGQGKRSTATQNLSRRGIAFGALAGCFAVLVHSAFDFVLHITAVSVLFLTLLAMLVACSREYHDDIDDTPRSRRKGSVTPIAKSHELAE
jgi:O-antigen ligase